MKKRLTQPIICGLMSGIDFVLNGRIEHYSAMEKVIKDMIIEIYLNNHILELSSRS